MVLRFVNQPGLHPGFLCAIILLYSYMSMDYLKPSQVSEAAWARGYDLWLKHGYSLDMVGRTLGLRPNAGRSVSAYLQKHYGKDATNPKANSFLMSLAEDYPDSEWVGQLSPELERCQSDRFFSQRVERSLAGKGTAKTIGNRSNEMKYRIAYQQSISQSYDPWEQFEQPSPVITLSQFVWLVEVIISILGELILEIDGY